MNYTIRIMEIMNIDSLNTLKAFYESIRNSTKIKNKLLENIKSKEEHIIVMDLVELTYDFNKNTIKIDYYIINKEYQPITFDFEDFTNFLQNNIGKYNYTSALLLYSIFSTEREGGAELKDIVAFADYVNHAIMNFNEFNFAIVYLLKLGLVEEIDKKLFVKDSFREWYNNKHKNNKRVYLLGIIEKIQKYLNDKMKDNILSKNVKTRITEFDFGNGVNEYIENI